KQRCHERQETEDRAEEEIGAVHQPLDQRDAENLQVLADGGGHPFLAGMMLPSGSVRAGLSDLPSVYRIRGWKTRCSDLPQVLEPCPRHALPATVTPCPRAAVQRSAPPTPRGRRALRHPPA